MIFLISSNVLDCIRTPVNYVQYCCWESSLNCTIFYLSLYNRSGYFDVFCALPVYISKLSSAKHVFLYRTRTHFYSFRCSSTYGFSAILVTIKLVRKPRSAIEQNLIQRPFHLVGTVKHVHIKFLRSTFSSKSLLVKGIISIADVLHSRDWLLYDKYHCLYI